jgi:hypothetical protein
MPALAINRSQNRLVKKSEIYADYDGCHRYHIENGNRLSTHLVHSKPVQTHKSNQADDEGGQ